MTVNLVQHDDGSLQFVNELDNYPMQILGGPAPGNTSAAQPAWLGNSLARFRLIAGVDTGGGLLSWKNPFSFPLLVDYVDIYVSTVATAACSVEVGTTASSGTTASANLIDTLDVHTATGMFDNVTDHGTNGKSRQVLAVGAWLTVSTASGASAGLVADIFFSLIPGPTS